MKVNRLLVIAILSAVITFTFAGCGGATTDGNWLATGIKGEVYYMEISDGTGPVDYAFLFNGQIRRDHGGVIVHNDGTVEVIGFVDGVLKDCSACPYHLTNGNLVIDYTFQPYSAGGPVSGQLTFTSGDASTYQKDVESLNSQGG